MTLITADCFKVVLVVAMTEALYETGFLYIFVIILSIHPLYIIIQ